MEVQNMWFLTDPIATPSGSTWLDVRVFRGAEFEDLALFEDGPGCFSADRG